MVYFLNLVNGIIIGVSFWCGIAWDKMSQVEDRADKLEARNEKIELLIKNQIELTRELGWRVKSLEKQDK